jgi:Na+(H+)/acetate symporter ActP
LQGLFGIYPPGFVAQVVAFAFGLAASTIFPALFLGIFTKSVNKEGAISGMLSGLMFTSIYIVYFKFINPDLQPFRKLDIWNFARGYWVYWHDNKFCNFNSGLKVF